MAAAKKPLSIYIHIPFCVRKCLYCDFLSGPATEKAQINYVKALLKEIETESKNYQDYVVETVFIGGGTPSILPGEAILQILETLYQHYQISRQCEISMEVNPGTVTPQKALLWKKAGINRISIGLQSAIDQELQALGRIHNSSDFFETYRLLIKTGFNNINIDLMSAIPYQTLESWQQTLKLVTELDPPPVHISAYSLIIEEGTPFYEKVSHLPDEDTEREMYKITGEILRELGYQRYEISNYAKPGYECRHNQVYWKRGDYAGFGLGSASLVQNVRFHNCSNYETYVDYFLNQGDQKGIGKEKLEATSISSIESVFKQSTCMKEEMQKLTQEEQMEEFMFLGLRMMKGVSSREFYECFGKSIEEVYPGIIEKFCSQGLLFKHYAGDEEWIALTEFGIDVSNQVMAEFLLT